jgi:hypothetical protein
VSERKARCATEVDGPATCCDVAGALQRRNTTGCCERLVVPARMVRESIVSESRSQVRAERVERRKQKEQMSLWLGWVSNGVAVAVVGACRPSPLPVKPLANLGHLIPFASLRTAPPHQPATTNQQPPPLLAPSLLLIHSYLTPLCSQLVHCTTSRSHLLFREITSSPSHHLTALVFVLDPTRLASESVIGSVWSATPHTHRRLIWGPQYIHRMPWSTRIMHD